MREFLLVVLFAILAFALTGCGAFRADVEKAAQSATVPFAGDYVLLPDPEAEEILQGAFRRSDIPWDVQDAQKADQFRDAMDAQFEMWYAKVKLDGTLPYYNYKHGFEFIQFCWRNLIDILDRRVQDGALSIEEKVIYRLVRDNIEVKLDQQRRIIALAEDDINAAAEQLSIDQMKEVYKVMKPLISTVGKAVL